MDTKQTGYGNNIKDWTLSDMNLDNATAAANTIIAYEEQWKGGEINENILTAYWAACDFETAYNQFDMSEIEDMHDYRFADLLEIACGEIREGELTMMQVQKAALELAKLLQ